MQLPHPRHTSLLPALLLSAPRHRRFIPAQGGSPLHNRHNFPQHNSFPLLPPLPHSNSHRNTHLSLICRLQSSAYGVLLPFLYAFSIPLATRCMTKAPPSRSLDGMLCRFNSFHLLHLHYALPHRAAPPCHDTPSSPPSIT